MTRMILCIAALLSAQALAGCGLTWRPIKRSRTLDEQRMIYPSDPGDSRYVIVTDDDGPPEIEQAAPRPSDPASAPEVIVPSSGVEIIPVPEEITPSGESIEPAPAPATQPDE